jgi:carbamoyl-phosphate synthase (ammonia)
MHATSRLLRKSLGKSRHVRTGIPALSTAATDMRAVKLILEDGSVHEGYSFGAETPISGELVFSTGMVGYPEALTDPSFQGQLLSLTYPMVGNYGVPDIKRLDEHGLPRGFESDRIHASALIVQDYSHSYSHWDAKESLADWLKRENIPGLTGFDTRMLTRKIRSKGAMLARIEFEGDDTVIPNLDANGFLDSNARNLVAEVSVPEVRVFGKGNKTKVLAVDCGIKNNIIRMLVNKGAEVTVVPWDYKFSEVLDDYQGLFLSNGPGDPTKCTSTIDELKKVLKREGDDVKPIFGICLGNQLLALAAGAPATKLPFGNRGQNQPVINKMTGECYITPQNHGFAIDDSQLPSGWKTLFTNINDGSNEGIMHETKPYFTAQFHPEAMGGPTDTSHFFDKFLGYCNDPKASVSFEPRTMDVQRPEVKKVLLLGSGGLSIGQAGEFDYSGAQAIKALKEEGKEVILINPNIASVQTNMGSNSEFQCDQVSSSALLRPQSESLFLQQEIYLKALINAVFLALPYFKLCNLGVLSARYEGLRGASHQAREAGLNCRVDGWPDGPQCWRGTLPGRNFRQVWRPSAGHSNPGRHGHRRPASI